MNVVDSSAWLEYFADGPNAGSFAEVVEVPENLIVPVITVYEVFERICQQSDEKAAFDAVGVMVQSRVVDLTADLAVRAAQIGRQAGLPMADSLILATARAHDAVVWTQDADFEGLEGVRYYPAVGHT